MSPPLPAPPLAAAALSAVVLAAASMLGVVEGDSGAGPAFLSWPLLTLLGVLPAAVAAVLVARGRPTTAAGVLAGVAALAPGRAAMDLQFAVDAAKATRPEFTVPGAIQAGPSWPGVVLLLAGHAAAVVAGVLAVRASAALPDDARSPEGGSRAVSVMAVAAALGLAVGLVLPPYVSAADVILLDTSVVDGPLLVVLGGLAVALAAVGAVVLVLTETSWGLITGVLAGVALAGGSLALPNVVAAATTSWLEVSAGPIVVLVAAAVLLAVPVVSSLLAARDDENTPVKGPRLLYVASGAFGVLAAVFAVVGARNPLVRMSTGRTLALSDSQEWLIPAGAVVGVLGLAVLVPPLAAAVRPALAVAWAGLLLAAAPVLQRAVAAPDVLVDSSTGSGALFTAAAVAAALLAAGCAVVAGVLERDGAEPAEPGSQLRWPAAAAGVLAVVAFVLPAAESADYRGAALADGVDLSFSGTLVALLVVLGGLVLVPLSRPARAAGVLGGLAAVLLVRLLEPIVVGSGVGPGGWAAAGCLAVLVLMLVLTLQSPRR